MENVTYVGNGFGVAQIPFELRKKQMLMTGCGWYDLYTDEDRAKLVLADTEEKVMEIANKYEKIWMKINRK